MAKYDKQIYEETKTEEEMEQFLKIPDNLLALLYLDFSLLEICVLAKIQSLCQHSRGCIAQNDYFTWYFDINVKTFQRILNKLKSHKLITIKYGRREAHGTVRHIYIELKVLKSLKKEAKKVWEKYHPSNTNKTNITTQMSPLDTSKRDSNHYPVESPNTTNITTQMSTRDTEISLPNSVPITTQMSSDHYPAVGASIVRDDNILVNYNKETSSFESSPDGSGINNINLKNNSKNNEIIEQQNIQEDDDMARKSGEVKLKMIAYWESINPVAKYRYLTHNDPQGCMAFAWKDYGKPENEPNFYSLEYMSIFFMNEMDWLKENCYDTYLEVQRFKDAKEFGEEMLWITDYDRKQAELKKSITNYELSNELTNNEEQKNEE